MRAMRNGDEIVVTMSLDEGHVLCWGGPEDVAHGVEGLLRMELVAVEDEQVPELEYVERFDDLEALYERLRLTFTDLHRSIGSQ